MSLRTSLSLIGLAAALHGCAGSPIVQISESEHGAFEAALSASEEGLTAAWFDRGIDGLGDQIVRETAYVFGFAQYASRTRDDFLAGRRNVNQRFSFAGK